MEQTELLHTGEDRQRSCIQIRQYNVRRGRKEIFLRVTDKTIETACLQYRMLSAPAITRGARDFVPALSSTLSIMKMATIDVKAIVIYTNKPTYEPPRY
jgi:hypothetical protein